MTTETTMTITADEVMALERAHVLQTYRRAPVVFERGSGCRLYDAAGRGYLDFISGIGVSSLGHAHPRLVAAIAAQAEQLLHTSNLYFHPLQAEVATKLTAMSGLPRAFFCNSGTEAVEACLKFARRYWFTQGSAAVAGRGVRARLPRPDDGRALDDVGRALSHAVRAAARGVTFVSNSDPVGARRGGVGEDRRDHRRAAAGRRRRAPASAARWPRRSRRRARSPGRC